MLPEGNLPRDSLGPPWSVPYLTPEIEGCGGTLKSAPEDFVVEEIPAYPASGEGEHLYVLLEKRGLSTLDLVGRLSRELGLPRNVIGYAGLKDARAVTAQWISLLGIEEGAIAALEIEGVTVRQVTRHRNKIRLGHLRGNRFFVRVRGVRFDAQGAAERVLAVVGARGLPNWFGAQRFGLRRDTHELGRSLLLGIEHPGTRRLDFERRRLFLAAAQSQCFNAILAERLREFDGLLDGDVAWLHRNGACFRVESAALESARASAFEISASGPLFGRKCLAPSGRPLEIEDDVLSALGLTRELFAARSELDGARRPFRVPILDPECRQVGDDLELRFGLPPGSYATALLREIMKTDADVGGDVERA